MNIPFKLADIWQKFLPRRWRREWTDAQELEALASVDETNRGVQALMIMAGRQFEHEVCTAMSNQLSPDQRMQQIQRASAIYHLMQRWEGAVEEAKEWRRKEAERMR